MLPDPSSTSIELPCSVEAQDTGIVIELGIFDTIIYIYIIYLGYDMIVIWLLSTKTIPGMQPQGVKYL